MLKLQVSPAQGSMFDVDVDRDELVIGRSMSSDVAIGDRFLSRHHARLYRSGDDWLIEDLGSRNGTFVNGVRVESAAPVRAGDVITMSASLVKVYEEGQPPPQAAAPPPFAEPSVLRPATELLSMSTALPGTDQDPSGATFRRHAERLRLLNEVHQALAESIALDELLDLILDRVFDHLRPEKGAIYLKDADGGLFRAASRPIGLTDDQFTLSTSLCREVVEKGMAALVHDVEVDDRFAEAAEPARVGRPQSLVAAPLIHSTGSLGMIVLSSSARVRKTFNEDDLELLTSLASVAALRIRNVALTEEAVERRRLQQEVALARQIQMSLIPDSLPTLDGYDLYGGNIPSQGVSGDYFEVIERLDGRECVLFIADVSGKGIAASLLTAYIEALTSAPIEDGLGPRRDLHPCVEAALSTDPPRAIRHRVAGRPRSGRRRESATSTPATTPACCCAPTEPRCSSASTGIPLGLLPGRGLQLRRARARAR